MPKRRTRKITTATKQEPVVKTDGWKSQIVILFADIIGCSEISNHEDLSNYNDILEEFRTLFSQITKMHEQEFYKNEEKIVFQTHVRGDEGCLMIFRKDDSDVKADLWADDIDTAINIALDFKRRWLLSEYNKKKRIEFGKLTSDIAVGIHFGQAWINKDEKGYRPEGYAINLTKRIESHSREGAFTHIDISEAANDCLYFLTDEATYTFAPQRLIKPKGISQGINVFEVKHHFLPTDWIDDTTPVSKWRTFDPTDDDIKKIEKAHHANPTNLWLAEEYIMAQMWKISNDNKKLSLDNPYKIPEELARKLVSGPLHDAGCLCILGLILGEKGKYKEEQQVYEEAIIENKLYAEAFWYAAYSISSEIFEKYGNVGPQKGKKLEELSKDDQKRIDKVYQYYSKAHELKPWHLWIRYDYACELWRWGKKSEAVSMLESVLGVDIRFLSKLEGETYLEGIEKEPRIKKFIDLYVNKDKKES
jgi:class 3 adenylate cyclase